MMSPAGLALTISPNDWQLASHLDLLNAELVYACSGQLRRDGYVGLIVEMPPRHGKSELISHWTPSWFLGVWPNRRVILCSYGATFAATWGRRSRDILTEYGSDLFGVELRDDSSAMDRWELEVVDTRGVRHRAGMPPGGMTTAGIGGPITGKGGHLIVVDDPVKNAEEALSPIVRQNHWEWFTSTLWSRREPLCVIVIVMTRWHEDDLAGRLKKRMASDPLAPKWRIVTLPAVAERTEVVLPSGGGKPFQRRKGQALWPQRYDLAELDLIRRGLHPDSDAPVSTFWWETLYQQNPKPQAYLGTFKNAQWQFLDADQVPKVADRVRAWDIAATLPKRPSDDPDWTAGVRMARAGTRYFVEDVRWFRGTPGEVNRKIQDVAFEDGPYVKIREEREGGASGVAVIDHRHQGLKGYDYEGIDPQGDKQLRADPFAAAVERGDVFIVRGPWTANYVTELRQFPYGGHDDQVDASSLAYSTLSVGTALPPPEHPSTGEPSVWDQQF